MMKFTLVLYVMFISSLYGETVQDFIPIIATPDHSTQKRIKQKEDKVLELDTQKLWSEYEKWKKLNISTYVYVCKANNNVYELIFVSDNHFVKSMNIRDIENENIFTLKKVEEIHNSQDRLLKRRRFRFNISNLHYYLLYGKYDLLNGLSSVYKNFNFFLEYDKKFHYLSTINVIHGENIAYPKDISPIVIYSYGLFLLPKETEYTDDVVKKILNKYEEAWECEKKLLAFEKINNEHNLTLLEKAVGKEKLECLDRYLAWDENGLK